MQLPQAHIVPILIPNQGQGYRLDQTFTSHVSHGSIVVPSGFEYDGGSAPRWTWSVFGMLPDGINREAALVHDYLYRYGVPFSNRLLIDALFYTMLKDYGIDQRRAKVAYYAVRLFGGRRFKTTRISKL